MQLLILFFLLAIGVSFICSILEAVLLSISDSYVAMLDEEGKIYAQPLRQMKQNIDRPLATILSLNTIAHTVGAAGVGAQAQIIFGETSLTIVSVILTLLILFLSEIIPKTLGARFWRQLTPMSVKLLQVLMVALAPLVWVCQKITGSLGKDNQQTSFNRGEFAAMAQLGAEEGVLRPEEAATFKNLVYFESLTGHDVMTPRTVVYSLAADTNTGDAIDNLKNKYFSRFPIYGEHKEDILGYVLKIDVYLNVIKGHKNKKLIDLRREILTTSENISLKEIFDHMMVRHEHICALVDEYGGFCGILTMEDIIETILGMEIMDEVDTIDDMQSLARRHWQKRAARNGLKVEDQ